MEAKDWYGRPDMGVKGFGLVWRTGDVCEWVGKGVERVLELIWRTYSRVVWKAWDD